MDCCCAHYTTSVVFRSVRENETHFIKHPVDVQTVRLTIQLNTTIIGLHWSRSSVTATMARRAQEQRLATAHVYAWCVCTYAGVSRVSCACVSTFCAQGETAVHVSKGALTSLLEPRDSLRMPHWTRIASYPRPPLSCRAPRGSRGSAARCSHASLTKGLFRDQELLRRTTNVGSLAEQTAPAEPPTPGKQGKKKKGLSAERAGG